MRAEARENGYPERPNAGDRAKKKAVPGLRDIINNRGRSVLMHTVYIYRQSQ